jgi:hypothetical protein
MALRCERVLLIVTTVGVTKDEQCARYFRSASERHTHTYTHTHTKARAAHPRTHTDHSSLCVTAIIALFEPLDLLLDVRLTLRDTRAIHELRTHAACKICECQLAHHNNVQPQRISNFRGSACNARFMLFLQYDFHTDMSAMVNVAVS